MWCGILYCAAACHNKCNASRVNGYNVVMQTTQQQVRDTVQKQQDAVRKILELAPVPDGDTDYR